MNFCLTLPLNKLYRVSGPIGPPRLFHLRKNYVFNFHLLFRLLYPRICRISLSSFVLVQQKLKIGWRKCHSVKENTLSHRDKVISNKNTNNLSPHNSDLNPKDYHLFGLMNDNVHANRSQSIVALKDEIQRNIESKMPKSYPETQEENCYVRLV